MTDTKKQWTVATAKAHLSEVIDLALTKGPQVVTRSGIKTVVIVSNEEWERKTKRKGTLADFLADSPLRNSEIEISRAEDTPRTLDLSDRDGTTFHE
ncbi:MAG: type II toxin-antitoxin system prevent-host-death family antitoxin [Candidatus Melainabacteria bacterium]|nr:type II toxin-antitoxin system prevent-host-death family antitoxin [Candidatus Melainabacteria bacterium]